MPGRTSGARTVGPLVPGHAAEPDDVAQDEVTGHCPVCRAAQALWHYARWQQLATTDNSEDDVRALTAKLDPSLASYTVVIGLGLWQPKVAVILYLVITLFMIIPFRFVLREARRMRRS